MTINRVKTPIVTLANDGGGILKFDFTRYLQSKPAVPGIITRLIAGIVSEGTTIAEDTFTRVVAPGGWGNADSGQAWVPLGDASSWEVTAGVGRHNIPAAGTRQEIHLPLNLLDASISFTFVQPGTVAGYENRAIARVISTSDYVYARIANTSTPFAIGVSKRVAGVETNLLSTTKALVHPVKVRFTVEGVRLSGKWWNSTDSEPAGYDLETGINTPIPVAGGLGRGYLPAAEAIGADRDIDNLTVTAAAPTSPTWDAYVGETNDPTNLQDSSQGVAFPRWVPGLVNGQPMFYGDELNIVAIGGTPGSKIFGSCYLVTED